MGRFAALSAMDFWMSANWTALNNTPQEGDGKAPQQRRGAGRTCSPSLLRARLSAT